MVWQISFADIWGGGHLPNLMVEESQWQNGEWQAVGRTYLESGGGFVEDEISLFAFSGDAGWRFGGDRADGVPAR